MSRFSIRLALAEDYKSLGEIMYEAVQFGAPEYTAEQRRAWVPEPRSGSVWDERLSNQSVFLAEDESSQALGFMGLSDDYLDLAFVSPSARRMGIFRSLYQAVEDTALANGSTRIWTHASLTARPAFEAVGFQVIKRESVTARGVALDRFEMEKHLSTPVAR